MCARPSSGKKIRPNWAVETLETDLRHSQDHSCSKITDLPAALKKLITPIRFRVRESAIHSTIYDLGFGLSERWKGHRFRRSLHQRDWIGYVTSNRMDQCAKKESFHTRKDCVFIF